MVKMKNSVIQAKNPNGKLYQQSGTCKKYKKTGLKGKVEEMELETQKKINGKFRKIYKQKYQSFHQRTHGQY